MFYGKMEARKNKSHLEYTLFFREENTTYTYYRKIFVILFFFSLHSIIFNSSIQLVINKFADFVVYNIKLTGH